MVDPVLLVLQLHWLSFLDIPDLANVCAVCKSFLVSVNKLYTKEFAENTGADAPQMMPRIDKLNLLRRVRRPLAPESMPYLLTMAAGRTGELLQQSFDSLATENSS